MKVRYVMNWSMVLNQLMIDDKYQSILTNVYNLKQTYTDFLTKAYFIFLIIISVIDNLLLEVANFSNSFVFVKVLYFLN